MRVYRVGRHRDHRLLRWSRRLVAAAGGRLPFATLARLPTARWSSRLLRRRRRWLLLLGSKGQRDEGACQRGQASADGEARRTCHGKKLLENFKAL
jgi:hypothetical protein